MEFDRWVAGLPKYFAADGDMVMSHVLTVLSSTFPDGEKYFVRSVAAVRDEITDPQLQADVDGFIGQEQMHGREHKVLNERLAEHGYPTRGIDSYVRGLYRVREPLQGKKVNLAFTAALEHYTATLAELLLTDEQARKAVGRPGARDILTWHALEESEHKAVAFDVYKAVGGRSEERRVGKSVDLGGRRSIKKKKKKICGSIEWSLQGAGQASYVVDIMSMIVGV